VVSIFAASQPTDLYERLVEQLGFDPIWAGALGLVVSMLSRLLWIYAVRVREMRRYGGWVLKVAGGKTGRSWHTPVDIDLIKALKTKRYLAIKRDLGTMLSGEGMIDRWYGELDPMSLRLRGPRSARPRADSRRIVLVECAGSGTPVLRQARKSHAQESAGPGHARRPGNVVCGGERGNGTVGSPC
jgi:hypothetical protein